MELFLLILVAGLVGYWLARSRFSKSVDQAVGRVSENSRDAADRASGWFRGLFVRKAPAKEVVDAEFEGEKDLGEEVESEAPQEPEPQDVKPAKKTTSRRKRTTSAKEEEASEG